MDILNWLWSKKVTEINAFRREAFWRKYFNAGEKPLEYVTSDDKSLLPSQHESPSTVLAWLVVCPLSFLLRSPVTVGSRLPTSGHTWDEHILTREHIKSLWLKQGLLSNQDNFYYCHFNSSLLLAFALSFPTCSECSFPADIATTFLSYLLVSMYI